MRLRLETAKKLRALGAKRKAAKEKEDEGKVTVTPTETSLNEMEVSAESARSGHIESRKAKTKKSVLATAPVPKARFRKRQVHKSWLPTHLYHTKRAHMTPASEPLWRFSIPLTPTTKSYRPTHRASGDRGAVAWDMSYMSTIGLEGPERSIENLLKALGIVAPSQLSDKWKRGTRVVESWAIEREAPHNAIAPVTTIWKSEEMEGTELGSGKNKRKLVVRVHPSAFMKLWEEIVRLGKVQRPTVMVEDLRFEIGSIEITGPGATEALLGALWLSQPDEGPEAAKNSIETTWTSLRGISSPAMLPRGALLGFDIQDPRLHYPPRTVKAPDLAQQSGLVDMLAQWPVDAALVQAKLFDRNARLASSRALASQKAINRRKSLAPPGQYPPISAKDPKIPILLYATSKADANSKRQATWTVLLPWKVVQSVWYSIMYYPLSTGGQVRLGGLKESRQIAFEAGAPWYPGDFPGTKAGNDWEMQERGKRRTEWERKPKAKRIHWDSVDVGGGRKGEVGEGWSCDWGRLLASSSKREEIQLVVNTPQDITMADKAEEGPPPPSAKMFHLPASRASALLRAAASSAVPSHALITVRLTLITRGVPETCARIYRLPSNADLRRSWLALLPGTQPKQHGPKHGLPKLSKSAPLHEVQRQLARSLLKVPQAGTEAYPECPDEDDLIGFVTTGNFNLGEGMGTGIGSIRLARALEDTASRDLGRLCIVRNAGVSVARLARWDLV